ncbi:AraC family transcriptional regulator [Xanthobacter sp. V2C-8]|uniref:helix-turn-helix domain-containing protein n=1 Tax=Xanthobacter albus TaxID=3119929 RepID=UPI00372A1D52
MNESSAGRLDARAARRPSRPPPDIAARQMASFVPSPSPSPAHAQAEPAAPRRFSTRAFAPADQFAAWRDFTAPVVDLSLASAPDGAFVAEQEVWDLGSMALTVATMPGTGYVRSWRHWRQPALDHWCLVLCPPAAGGTPVFGLRSLASPFHGMGADEQVISLFLPRDLFPQLATRLDDAPADLPLEGLGVILADHLASLARHLPRSSAQDLPQIAAATRALVAAAVAPRADDASGAGALVAHTLRERARRIIRQNIASATLSPESLCRALGVSRSRLYRLFEELGGVSRYIQRQRLLAAFAMLGDPRERRTVAQIAETLGFMDHSGFSRAFRAEFGLSPSAARACGTPARPAPPPAEPARHQGLRDLGDVLGRLQP